MSIDYPRAWKLANASKKEDHDPQCSWVQEDGAFLCDCDFLLKHPETLEEGVMYTRGGKVYQPENAP